MPSIWALFRTVIKNPCILVHIHGFPECIASTELDTGTTYSIDSRIECRLDSIDHQFDRDQNQKALSDAIQPGTHP